MTNLFLKKKIQMQKRVFGIEKCKIRLHTENYEMEDIYLSKVDIQCVVKKVIMIK